jgi:hypothetical protein
MILPKKVKILGRTFSVEYKDFSEAIHSSIDCGNTTYYKQQIQLDNAAHREYQEMALLHEITHAIDNALSLELGEKNIRQLGMSLYQVLNDNGFLKEGE